MNDIGLKNKRYVELDFIRGLAVFGMIIFHFFFILDFYDVIVVNIQEGWWYFFAEVVRVIFLMLVGISMHISYNRSANLRALGRQIQRGLLVFALGLMVTTATYIFMPEAYVRFGILHLIGTSIIFWSLFIWNKYLVLLVTILAFSFGEWPNSSNVYSIDYFAFLPWAGVVGLGIFAGYFVYPKGKSKFELPFFSNNFLEFLGRNSLWVYMLHVPLILAVLLAFGVLKSV